MHYIYLAPWHIVKVTAPEHETLYFGTILIIKLQKWNKNKTKLFKNMCEKEEIMVIKFKPTIKPKFQIRA